MLLISLTLFGRGGMPPVTYLRKGVEKTWLFSVMNLKRGHVGPEDMSNRKRDPDILFWPSCWIWCEDSEYVDFKIGPCRPKKLGPIFSLFLMRKPLSNGQKWFLRPYVPLIRGMFLLRSGLSFSFFAWTESEEKATFTHWYGLFLTLGSGTSSAGNFWTLHCYPDFSPSASISPYDQMSNW